MNRLGYKQKILTVFMAELLLDDRYEYQYTYEDYYSGDEECDEDRKDRRKNVHVVSTNCNPVDFGGEKRIISIQKVDIYDQLE